MTYDNFTIKAQELILRAQQIAGGLDQQSVDTVHILRALFEIDDQLADFIFNKLDMNVISLKREINKSIESFPKVEGSDKKYLTNDANKALAKAKKLMKEYGDEYISVELILSGILAGNDKASKILKDNGATEKGLKAAIAELRKGTKVTDQHSDSAYNSLKK